MSIDSSQASHVFTGVPTFFRACCRDAARANSWGHACGYDHPGHEFGRHLAGYLVPYSVELDEWHDIVHRDLAPLIEARDDAAVIAWLVAHYPKCMALVPKRRRGNFLRGFYEGFDFA